MNNEDRNSQERFDRALDRAENLRDEQRNAIHARVLARGDEDHMIGPTYLAATATVATPTIDLRNVTGIDRSSDMSVRVSFASARAASQFGSEVEAGVGRATVAKDGGEVGNILQEAQKRVWAALDRKACPGVWMQLASDAIFGFKIDSYGNAIATPKPEASAPADSSSAAPSDALTAFEEIVGEARDNGNGYKPGYWLYDTAVIVHAALAAPSPTGESLSAEPAGWLYGNTYYERENRRTTEHIKQHGRPLYAAPNVPGEPT